MGLLSTHTAPIQNSAPPSICPPQWLLENNESEFVITRQAPRIPKTNTFYSCTVPPPLQTPSLIQISGSENAQILLQMLPLEEKTDVFPSKTRPLWSKLVESALFSVQMVVSIMDKSIFDQNWPETYIQARKVAAFEGKIGREWTNFIFN